MGHGIVQLRKRAEEAEEETKKARAEAAKLRVQLREQVEKNRAMIEEFYSRTRDMAKEIYDKTQELCKFAEVTRLNGVLDPQEEKRGKILWPDKTVDGQLDELDPGKCGVPGNF